MSLAQQTGFSDFNTAAAEAGSRPLVWSTCLNISVRGDKLCRAR